MGLTISIVADDLADMGAELQKLAVGILGEDAFPAQAKGLAGYTDKELASELVHRGYNVDLITGSADVATEDVASAETPVKKAEKKSKAKAEPTEDAAKDEPAPDGDESTLSGKEAYDKGVAIMMEIYANKPDAKSDVMAVLKEYGVKSFMDIDADENGVDLLEKASSLKAKWDNK